MNLNLKKETKESLAQKLQEAAQVAQANASLANFYGSKLLNIEKLILDSPLGKGKFFKTLFWVITNHKALIKLIEEIVAQIKEWRAKIEEIVAQQQSSSNAPTV